MDFEHDGSLDSANAAVDVEIASVSTDSVALEEVKGSSTSSSAVVLPLSRGPAAAQSLLQLEHQFVKVPFEVLKKSIRAGSRAIEKEMSAVASAVSDAANKDASRETVMNSLSVCVDRLRGLKRKMSDIAKSEEAELQRSRARIEHLVCLTDGDKDKELQWKRIKLDRILVDYMLRSSYVDTASKLVQSSSIEDLADVALFREAQQIIQGLKERDSSKALAWCAENKGKLKKLNSKFEFDVRLQHFLELVRLDKLMPALEYMRAHISPMVGTDVKSVKALQRAMVTLVLRKATEFGFYESYKVLFSEGQWENLIRRFKDEFYRLHGMLMESLLLLHFQAGLTAMKTPLCYEEGCRKEDPLSLEAFRKLAEPLPFSMRAHSTLVCHITKELMNEDNPPLALPNGYVYSEKALEKMAKDNNGAVTCPRTGAVFSMRDTTRVYVS